MRLFKRDTTESVAARIVAAGAPADVAETIVGALLGCGLSPSEAREWLGHEERSYPIKLPFQMGDLPPMMLSNTPLILVERGNSEAVLSAALEFAGASDDERTIARLFGGDIDAARRLTRLDAARTRTIAAIAMTMLKTLGTPERVCYAGQTRLPGHGDRRIVDRLLAREQDAVARELADGTIDARELERSGELVFTGW
jgi:hypothetical protein